MWATRLPHQVAAPRRAPGPHMGMDDRRVDICTVPFPFAIVVASNVHSIQKDQCSRFSYTYAARSRLLCVKCRMVQAVDVGTGEGRQP